MRALAAFIMRGRSQAILAAVGFMGLSLLFPVLSYISAAAVALVALRLGWREGAIVAGAGMAATAVLAWLAVQQPAAGILFAVIVWLPVTVLALVLRSAKSWAVTLNVAALLGAMGVLGFYAVVDDPAAWWRDSVISALQTEVVDRAGLSADQAEFWRTTLDQMANVMTGIVAAAFVFSAVLGLLLARWWQSMLYNPGGFRTEFHALQLGKPLALAALVLALASLMFGGNIATIARDLVMVVLLLFMLQGLSVTHALVAARGAGVWWLVALYGLLMIALPQVVLVLAIAGLMDTWINLRRRKTAPG